MATTTVRGSLHRAGEEIEDICANNPVSESTGDRLLGIAEQLQYLAEGDSTDPEAMVRPDPDSLDTISDHLTELISNTDGETAMRLERARDEVLLAISMLDDRIEKEHDVPGSTG